MKRRLAPLLAGDHRRSISNALSALPKFNLFSTDAQRHSRFHCQQSDFSNLSESSTKEDDKFSDLGAPMPGNGAASWKLVTEKPENFVAFKPGPARKVSAIRSKPADRLSIKDICSSLDKPLQLVGQKPGNRKKDASRSTICSQDHSNATSVKSLSIENVPLTVSLSQLVDAISKFGRVSNASIRSSPNGRGCFDIEFENDESWRRAISAKCINVSGTNLSICPRHASNTVTIRIQGISSDTTHGVIHSVCKSIGQIEGLTMVRGGAVDAVFNVIDDSDSTSVLEKLNGTIISDCCWSAEILPAKNTAPMPKTEEVRPKMGLQLSTQLRELKSQIELRKVYLEDLHNLHLQIMHLEGLPTTCDL